MRKLTAILSVGLVSALVGLPAVGAAAQETLPMFGVGLHFNGIGGDFWPAGTDVTVTADDPQTAMDPDISLVLTTDTDGHFHGHQVFPGLEGGWFITATDGETIKRHTVTNLAITDVDPASDIMYGTADPFFLVAATTDGNPAVVFAYPDDEGNWSADLSSIADVTAGTVTRALQFGDDQDGDFTFTDWQVPFTLEDLLADMVDDGRLPNAGIERSILKQAQHAPPWALTNHLNALVGDGAITQETMDQILAFIAA